MMYFDHAASTSLRPNCLELLKKSLEKDFANPSAAHKLGRDLGTRIERARTRFLDLLDAKNYDFFFTSSATESNNTVIKGFQFNPGDKVFYSLAEHKSLTAPLESLAGIELCKIPLSSGTIDLDALLEQLDDKSKMLVFCHVNNNSGNIQDVEEISARVKATFPNIHIHVDGVQGFGKLPFNLKSGNVDSYSVSGHKIGAPKGISGLYLKSSSKIGPLLHGGGQEMGFRSSTQFAPLIFAYEVAAVESFETLEESSNKVAAYKTALKCEIEKQINKAFFPFEKTSPYILSFVIPGIPSDIILRHLEMKAAYISSSSACSSKIKGFNPVYKSLGLDDKFHKNVLRISFSSIQTEEEVSKFKQLFIETFNELKIFMK